MVAKTVRDTFQASDPAKPLASDDPRYVDLTEVRGNEDVVRQLKETITWSDSATCQLFTGHRGCGKSTELLRLKDQLEQAEYCVIYFEADDILDLNDLVYSDLLVAIAKEVYEGLEELNIALDDALINEVTAWFNDVLEETTATKSVGASLGAELSVSTPKILSPLVSLLTTITGQLQTGVESKRQVRKRLDPQISQLIENINLLLQGANAKLRKQGKQGLVVIIDNLDRISFRSLDSGERNTHDALYIEHGEQLRNLHCDIVYTVPISMLYSARATILTSYFPDHVVVPMIKVREKDNSIWQEGLHTLRQILAQRIALDEVFEKKALERLCTSSGGHPRDLMVLVRSACRYASDHYPKPIDLNAAEKAVNRLVSDFSRMIPEEHFPLLAEVHRVKKVKNDAAHQFMLHNLTVLEYVNGSLPWHDVHPAILALPKFKEAATYGND